MKKNLPKDHDDKNYEKVFEIREDEQRQTLSQTEHVEVARRKAAVSFWEWVGKKGVPLFGWTIVGSLAIICVSLLAVWLSYVLHLLLKPVDFSRIDEIKSFLGNVYGFLGGVASTSLLFYLNRKPPR